MQQHALQRFQLGQHINLLQMSSGDEAPAIKLYNSKKEQEMYENYAGELMGCPPPKLGLKRIWPKAAHRLRYVALL